VTKTLIPTFKAVAARILKYFPSLDELTHSCIYLLSLQSGYSCVKSLQCCSLFAAPPLDIVLRNRIS